MLTTFNMHPDRPCVTVPGALSADYGWASNSCQDIYSGWSQRSQREEGCNGSA